MKTIAIKPSYGDHPNAKKVAYEKHLLKQYKRKLKSREVICGPVVSCGFSELRDSELELLKSRVKKNDSVLDVGSGFGILSEAALEMGASKVWALETDMRAFNSLSKRVVSSNVCSVYGKAQNIITLGDNEVDLALSMGNGIGMMWNVTRDWESLVCQQKEAILEMIRVARREVSFSVYSEKSIVMALNSYLSQNLNVVGIQNNLVLIEEKDEGKKPYHIRRLNGSWDKFVFQFFDREYLEGLMRAAGLEKNQYKIEEIPKGNGFGYLITISCQ